LALQQGASGEELRESLEHCVLCGACEPACPEEIDTIGMTLKLRQTVPLSQGQAPKSWAPKEPIREARRLLPGDSLRSDPTRLARIQQLLQIDADDDGADIAFNREAGLSIDPVRMAQWLDRFREATDLVVVEGSLHTLLRQNLPHVHIKGLAEALLERTELLEALRPDDLLVIEPRGFHSDHRRLVRLIDSLRQQTGCMTNLDLQRLATATGAGSVQQTSPGQPPNGIDPQSQARWILQGLSPTRIVVESPAERPVFAAVATVPVVHLSEII